MREVGPIFTAAGRHLFAGPLAEHVIAGAFAASAAEGTAQHRLTAVLGGEGLLAVVDAAVAGEPAGPELGNDRLTGGCELVRFAGDADELLVVAQRSDGGAVLVIPTARAGVVARARPGLDPATAMARVRFEDVEVDEADIVVAGEDAGELIERIRAGMRIAIACELSGIAEHSLTLAVVYAKERHQFGRPIGSFQALQHILADMARESFGLGRLCREAVTVTDPELLAEVGLVTKAHAATAARSVVEGSLQVHGGIAFTIEHQLHRYYKHLLFLEGLYGDRREIYAILGRRLLNAAGDLWPAWR
jgi:alkylation response protein AidB-like acyl-CoA dehydrogenase